MGVTITRKPDLCAELRRLLTHISEGGASWRPSFGLLQQSLEAWEKTREAPDGRTASLASMNGISLPDLQRVRAEIEASKDHLASRNDRAAASDRLRAAIDILETPKSNLV